MNTEAKIFNIWLLCSVNQLPITRNIWHKILVWPNYIVLSCSVLFDSAILWTVAHQAPLSMGFPRQEYWSRFPFLSPGDLPHPGIEPASPITPALEEDSLPLGHLGSPYCCTTIKTCFVSNYKIWWQIFTYSWIL